MIVTRIPRKLLLAAVSLWALGLTIFVTVLGVGAFASSSVSGLMITPAGKGYSYPVPSKPVCTTASHAYPWVWLEAPGGATTYTRVLVCGSSAGSTAGWHWRAVTTGTATVP